MPIGKAGCVLIRAVEPIEGINVMAKRRKIPKEYMKLTSGPGNLTQAFGITDKNNGFDLTYSSLYILDNNDKIENIKVSKRIGITKHADTYLRFFIDGNIYVSGTKRFNGQAISLEEFFKLGGTYLADFKM